jgi:NAD-dependent deacetylase
MVGEVAVDVSRYSGIVILTGAGISAASGIRTYRGPGGLWNDETLVRLSDGNTFKTAPLDVWRFWSGARRLSMEASPNAAHLALAGLERRLRPGQGLTIVTQNIDGLHGRAGSSRVVEFHGSVLRTRCSSPFCDLPPFEDRSLYEVSVPSCPRCGAPLRPDLVLFNEAIPERDYAEALAALERCDLFVAIGTSGTVYPASGFVDQASARGARTVFLNLESLGEGRGRFGEEYLGRAEETVPRVFGEGPGS